MVRLDPTDAEFVDAMHTDTKTILVKGFGIEHRIGHIDTYPNGGYEQPNCRTLENGMYRHKNEKHELIVIDANLYCSFVLKELKLNWDQQKCSM